MQPTYSISPDGVAYRDLNGNGVMDPYEDPRRAPEERTVDLLARLSLEEKVGLLFQTGIAVGEQGTLLEEPGMMTMSATSDIVGGKLINHFNVHHLDNARNAARWSNSLQRLAENTPHGIPVTVSTDPRHAFVENVAASFAEGPFSKWPDGLGLAALRDTGAVRDFARTARDEYRAVGIRAALHPQVDLASEPRWTRGLQTFGADVALAVEYTRAYIEGFQGEAVSHESVACTTKHFPGAGPQKDGEDAHFPYGREQVYRGGAFEEHLEPFREAIRAGTAAMMPYYGMPQGLVIDGEEIEEVGFGYNRQILTGLLREQLGYTGVIVTDWELVNDNVVGNQVLPARAWGVEHLDPTGRMLKIIEAGADQFGGEECTELLLELVRSGQVTEARIDESAQRLLLVKFQLGLFDDPFVDEDHAEQTLGNPDSHHAGFLAQARSVVVLENREVDGRRLLPLRPGLRIYVEGIDASIVSEYGTVVADPADADVALVRIGAPFEPRDDLFLEKYFHQGSLDLQPGLVYRLKTLAALVPLHVDVSMDRPAVLTPLVDAVAGLSVTFGVSERALLSALTDTVRPSGRLPVELPRSMEDVRQTPEDVTVTPHPLYPIGAGSPWS
ncbi:glycoside hydrolase family 3 protein [Cellulomonas sp. McL0617]|uniref:glycoside hydrolase family 3 protein n=1 Tax=Cellulomonas sp. McL0617 TaxID=3415675 RepID=UPI003CEB382C